MGCIILPSAIVFVEGNVFISVCHSVRGVSASGSRGCLPLDPEGAHSQADIPISRHTPIDRHTPLGRHPPGQTPPRQTPLGRTPGKTPPETATAVDGTHPTGMHSCLHLHLPHFQLARGDQFVRGYLQCTYTHHYLHQI